MIPEAAIRQLLLNDTTVSDSCGQRITPVAVRIDTGLPAVTVARQNGIRDYTFNGPASATVTILLTAWSTEYTEARNLADAMRRVLDMADSNDIEIATVTDAADGYNDEVSLFGCSILVTVQYEED